MITAGALLGPLLPRAGERARHWPARHRCLHRRAPLQQLVVLAAAALPVAAESQLPRGPEVCHGRKVPPHAFPWLVKVSQEGGSLCTGTLVGPSTVLTAAHCVDELTRSARAASACVGGRGGECTLEPAACVHPSWQPDSGHGLDVALLHLSTPSRTSPIPLISNETTSLEQVGEPVVLAGFGYECPGFSEDAHYTDALTVIGRSSCQRQLNADLHPIQHPWNISTVELCAQDAAGLSGAAIGDSGGPLFHEMKTSSGSRYVQVGVVHGGQAEGIGLPDVYTRVLPALAWIHEVVSGHEPPPCKKLVPPPSVLV